MKPFIYIILSLFSLTLCQLTTANSIDPQTAVNEHNKWRNALNQGTLTNQPIPVPYIEDMYWDQSLADSAQAHADQCVWEHSGTGGENLYAQSYNGSIEQGIDLWGNEVSLYTYEPFNTSNVSQIGHYTQMVWQSSLKVGCAKAACSPLKNSDGSTLFNGEFYVCQYRESGNWIGQYPYSVSSVPTSLVSYNSNNTNLQIPLLKVGSMVYRAKLTITSFDPVVFKTITYEQINSIDLNLYPNISEYNITTKTLTIRELSIDGINKYQAVLKDIGNLNFQLISYGVR